VRRGRCFDWIENHLMPFTSESDMMTFAVKVLLHTLYVSLYFTKCIARVSLLSYFFKSAIVGGKVCANGW